MGTRCCFIFLVTVVKQNVIIKFASHICDSVLETAICFEIGLHEVLRRRDHVPPMVNIGYDHANIAYSISLLRAGIEICIGRRVEAAVRVNSDTDLEVQIFWQGTNHSVQMTTIVFVVGEPY